MGRLSRECRTDALIALLLAVVLGAAWAAHDWANLAQLHLPDTDDVVRLQQVRDWLGGQGWADLTQHRLGQGVPMHWSRLADLGPALGIVLLTPLLGRHAAEVGAVTAWPLVLFALALFLVARIARRLGPGLAGTATVIAAISFPATTLFLPGRIDHHGLQMVLLLAALLAALRPASAGTGFAIGMLAAASLVIGLETAPLLAVLGATIALPWIGDRDERGGRLGGLGVGALAGLAIGRGVFATTGWDFPACDGFDGQAWRAAVALAFVPVILAALSPWLTGLRTRSAAALAATAEAGGVAIWLSPACLSPYGQVDPALSQLWLSQVGEAQPLLSAVPAIAVSYVGLMLAGVVASLWRLRRGERAGWGTLFALQGAAALISLVQLRGAYAGALLAAPALAAAVRAARARGAVPLIGAWAASAGMLYPLAAEALPWTPAAAAEAGPPCDAQLVLERLAALPAGRVAAPIDFGAYGLAATRHRFLAAPYHRDGAGILAAHHLLTGSPEEAMAIARQWRVDYAVTCIQRPAIARLTGWRALGTTARATIWINDRLSAGPAPL